MPIHKYEPTSPGRRGGSVLRDPQLSKDKPEIPGPRSTCDRDDCTEPPTIQMGLILNCPQEFGDHPCPVAMALYCCDACATEFTLVDLLGDNGWEQLVAGFTDIAKMEPDRWRTKVTRTPISKAP